MTESSGGVEKKNGIWSVIAYSVCFSLLIIVFGFLQTARIEIFGQVPSLALAAVVAIGFIAGEKYGAVFGIAAGVIVAYLGHSGITLDPVIYMLCGYFCGAMRGWFLSHNFISFLIYVAIVGAVKEIVFLIGYMVTASRINLWDVTVKTVIPDYFIFVLCTVPTYFIILGIYKLFKGKDGKVRRTR